MKSRLFTIAIAVLVTASAFAQKPPVRRTVIIKDGKVITDDTRGLDASALLAKRAYLGISMVDLSPELREHYGVSKDTGVLVESVADGSPAEKAGIKVGDIITSIDGDDIKSTTDIRSALRDKKGGDPARVEFQRGKGRQTVVATLDEREGPRMFMLGDLDELTKNLGSHEWRAQVQNLGGDCEELRGRIKELETRLKELEKKLQK
jgi:serine protease Do